MSFMVSEPTAMIRSQPGSISTITLPNASSSESDYPVLIQY